MAVAGDTVLVGAPRSQLVGPNAGAVFVFEKQGTAWLETDVLTASDAADLDEFGSSVTMAGNRALIGSLFDDDTASSSGSGYLFEKQRGTWVEIAKLRGSGATASEVIGVPADLTDEWAVLANTNGKAYVFSTTSSLCAGPTSISLAAGGTHALDLNAGSARANELYWILGSQSGTSPGTPAPPFTMPLNVDGWFLFTVLNPNTVIVPSLAFLDGFGHAAAEMVLPPGLPANLAGNTYDHAYLTLDLVTFQATFVSNAVPLSLVP